MSKFAETRLREIKIRLYREYGHGLKNLYKNKEFDFDLFHKGPSARLRANRKSLGQEFPEFPSEQTTTSDTVNVADYVINTHKPLAFAIGWAV